MSAARATAAPATQPAKAARAASAQRSPVLVNAAQSGYPIAQPGARCACGGGCPRCATRESRKEESDRYEHEARSVSARILNGPRLPAVASGERARSEPGAANPQPTAKSRLSASAPATGPPSAHRGTVRSTPSPRSLAAGRALTPSERDTFEAALGLDLRTVRVHDGPPAEAAAHAARAHAFALGSHIVLGRAVQRSGASVLHAVLVHELVHVVQQAGVPAANDPAYDHLARAPPRDVRAPSLSAAPVGVMRLDDDDALIPSWASNAATRVASAGAGAFDTVAEAAGNAADFALDTAAVVVDRLAPGLLPFLRGGALGQLTDLFCSGIDSLLADWFSALGSLDFMGAIEASFSALAEGVRGVQAAIGSTASAALGTLLGPLVEALQEWGGPLVSTLQSVATTVDGMFGTVWDNFAVPALGFLERVGGEIWNSFNRLVTWVWDLVEPIRTGAETAWNWLLDTFDLAWQSTSGVRDWLAETASSAWTAFLETIEPIREPLMAAAGIALLLSPVGPIIVLTQVVPPLREKITWLWNNWNSEDILVRAQDTLREDVLPAMLSTVSGVATAIGEGASWLAGLVGEFGAAMSGVIGAFGAHRCLGAVMRYLNGIAAQFERLAAWAESGFAGLAGALQAVFEALIAIFQPIVDFLVRLAMVVANPPMLPVAIAGAIWLLCPDELKPPVIDFVLDLLIAIVDGSTVFLVGLGPMAFVLQAGALGFLRELRGGERIDEQRRIDSSNKIANLAAGGGPAFILGFALGFLHGVLDGIIDPFRLIFLVLRVLVTGAQAIGRALAPFVLAHVSGAAAAVADVRATVAIPEPTAPAAAAPPEPVAQGPPPPSTPASGEIVSGESDGAPAAARAGSAAGTGSEALPALEAMPGDLTDSQIAASVGSGVSAEVTAAAAEPAVDEEALATEMRTETESEGATVAGLAQLLGDAWDWIVRGADSLGRSAANALVDFILLPDFQLGRKLGFVTGFIALQALIIYLTAGGYAVLEASAPLWRQALALFLRFLDLGGEILGLVGRALRPLRGPLLRGLGAARGFLSRFRFARGLIERIERLAATLFRFGDEAAGTGRRGAAETIEETAETGATRVAGQADAAVARESRERAAQEIAERGERASVEAAEDLGPGGLRSVDEPAVTTIRDEALRAAQFPRALAEAMAIEAVQDAIPHNPVTVALGALMLLKRRYRWIDRFDARPLGPGTYSIELVASPGTPIGRYTVDDLPEDIAQALRLRIEQARALGLEPDPAQVRRLADALEPDELRAALARTEAGFPAAAREVAEDQAARRGDDVAESLAEATAPPAHTPGGVDPTELSPLDRPRGSPQPGMLTGDIGEAAEQAAAGADRLVPTYASHASRELREDLRELFVTHGDEALREFTDRLVVPPSGLRQVEIPVRSGTRRVDRLFLDGDAIVLREVKNYPRGVLSRTRRIADELANDLEILGRYPEARVDWVLTGNVRADFLNELFEIEAANPGRFNVIRMPPVVVVP